MARTRVRWDKVASLGLMAAAAVTLLSGRAGSGSAGPGMEGLAGGRVYVVRQGDTVWGIAVSIVGPAGDPRPVVDRLVRVNGVRGGVILPGQALRLGP